jgi:pimeloyl-ACP methyl ester carboxylesterase
MPYATNPIDQVRTFFEDSGVSDPPVLVYPGFADPLEYAIASPLAQALKDDFRLIFADHRGQGRSQKPHEVAAYALTTRVADATAVLDTLGIERAHYIGFSWGPASDSRSESMPRSAFSPWCSAATSRMNGPLTVLCSRPSHKQWLQAECMA